MEELNTSEVRKVMLGSRSFSRMMSNLEDNVILRSLIQARGLVIFWINAEDYEKIMEASCLI